MTTQSPLATPLTCTLVRDVLLHQLQHLATLVPTRDTAPLTQQVKLTAKTNALELAVTNLQTWLTVTIPATITQPGSVTLPCKPLLQIVKALPDEALTLTSHGQTVTLTAGSAHFEIHDFAKDEFPTPPEDPARRITWTCLPAVLAIGLRRALTAIGEEDTRFVLNTIAWDLQKEASFEFCVGFLRVFLAEWPPHTQRRLRRRDAQRAL